jgi:hypothetical protein
MDARTSAVGCPWLVKATFCVSAEMGVHVHGHAPALHLQVSFGQRKDHAVIVEQRVKITKFGGERKYQA